MSVYSYRLSLRRTRDAQKRNPRKCPCSVSQIVDVFTASLGMKKIALTRHGAKHGVFHHEGCPHSTLASTTSRHVATPNRGREQKPPLNVSERKAKMRRLAALPNIPVIILE